MGNRDFFETKNGFCGRISGHFVNRIGNSERRPPVGNQHNGSLASVFANRMQHNRFVQTVEIGCRFIQKQQRFRGTFPAAGKTDRAVKPFSRHGKRKAVENRPFAVIRKRNIFKTHTLLIPGQRFPAGLRFGCIENFEEATGGRKTVHRHMKERTEHPQRNKKFGRQQNQNQGTAQRNRTADQSRDRKNDTDGRAAAKAHSSRKSSAPPKTAAAVTANRRDRQPSASRCTVKAGASTAAILSSSAAS